MIHRDGDNTCPYCKKESLVAILIHMTVCPERFTYNARLWERNQPAGDIPMEELSS